MTDRIRPAKPPPRKDTKRARIGLIIPSSNRIVEQELLPRFPPDVGVNIARVRMGGITTTDLLPSIAYAAESLSDAGCGVVAFQCTASSMEEGAAVNARVLETIAKAGGRIAVTTASALANAIEALSARDLVMLTPYNESVTGRQRAYLEEIGLRVLNCRNINVSASPEFFTLSTQYWLEELVRMATPGAQAYLLSCSNLACLSIIGRAEAALGRPVLTSNQAVFWDCLRQAGVTDVLEGLGQLGRLARVAN